MEFAFEHPQEGAYARLYPLFAENDEVKRLAAELGDEKMVRFGRDAESGEKFYQLFASRVPAGIDVDSTFGRFATEDAKAASVAEIKAHQGLREGAEKAVEKQGPDESRMYYPHAAVNKEFQDLRKSNTKAKMHYNGRAGAWVNTGEHDPAFDKFQTPEAKAAWQEQGKSLSRQQGQLKDGARKATGTVAQRAAGRKFEADNDQGFRLPQKDRSPAEYELQMSSLKRASDEEVTKSKGLTDSAVTALRRKQYGIQVSAAEKKGVTKEAFDQLDFKGRDEAAGANLPAADLATFFALVRGQKAINEELNGRGITLSREQARGKKEELQKTASGGREQQLDPDREPPAEPTGRAGSKGAAHLAAMMQGTRGR